jgi:hypothetical protein
MRALFDRKCLLNRTVNPDQPGLADFFIFLLKYLCILLPLYSVLSKFGWGELAIAIIVPLMEEQARVTWVLHAKNSLRAAMVFAVLMSSSEFVLYGRVMGAFASSAGIAEFLSVRLVPSACHFLYSLLAYSLLRREMDVVRVWALISLTHFLFNELVAEWISISMRSSWSLRSAPR